MAQKKLLNKAMEETEKGIAALIKVHEHYAAAISAYCLQTMMFTFYRENAMPLYPGLYLYFYSTTMAIAGRAAGQIQTMPIQKLKQLPGTAGMITANLAMSRSLITAMRRSGHHNVDTPYMLPYSFFHLSPDCGIHNK